MNHQAAVHLNRRHFLRAGLISATSLAAAAVPETLEAAPAKRASDPFRGLKVGLTSYTLRKFSLDQAIAMTRQAGVKYFSIKEVHLPLKSSLEQRQEARRKIEAAGLVLMGGGVIDMKNHPDEVRNDFEYARDLGMGTMVCTPVPEALDLVERLVKEFDQRIAIHNHGPTDKHGFPSPLDVLNQVKRRDPRMGICMDVGHTVRIGQDPVPIIKQCARRLYEFHMKDVTAADPKGSPVELGRGVIDIGAVLKALLKIKFPYHVALEYEANADAPMPGVTESIGYQRGALDAM